MTKHDVAMFIPDLHLPFEDEAALSYTIEQVSYYRPNIIVQLGDLHDFYSFTRFDRNFNLMTPREEVQLAREKSVKFWQAVRRRAPKAACYQLMGNHDVRPFKKLMKLAPELEDFFSHQGLFDFKGVTTIQDIREELILNINGQRVMCLHGFYTRRGQHLNANRISTVFAHTHIPWLHHTPLLGSPVLFELNCGFLGDRSTLPMSYTNQRKVSKWMHAFGVVDLRGPRYEIIQTN